MPARIIILGGGFVGLPAAKRIARTLGHDAEVTLVDRHDRFTFLPRLTDALENGAVPKHIGTDYAPLAKTHGFSFVQGQARSIASDTRTLTYADMKGAERQMSYDYLVYCPGSTTNFYGTPGAEEHCLTLKSWADVLRIHARIDDLVARAKSANDDAGKRHSLSFAVVGAGPTGIEAVFALRRHVMRVIAAQAPDLAPHASFALVQAAPQILPGFPTAIVDGAAMYLHKRGITTFVAEPVVRVTADMVETAHGRTIPAGLVLWTAGIKRQPVTIMPAAAEDPGHYLLVDRMLMLETRILAAGDAVSYKERHLTVPKNAQTAYRMSKTIADNVCRMVRGGTPRSFHYISHGTFLPLDDTGFIQFGPFVFRSKLAKTVRDLYYDKTHRDITT